MKNLFTILAAALLTANLWAQSPEKISYQAIIRNSSSQLVTNHSIGMQISILKGSETGTAVFIERHFPTTNANGLVSIVIGTGTLVSGGFTTIDWPADSYFLKTETDINGGSDYTITSTSQLLSVPYALYAKQAGNAFSGSYYDLTDKPALWDSTYTSIKNKPDLTVYATKDMAGQNITNLANPVNAQDAATKSYVDALLIRIETLELLEKGIIDPRDGNHYKIVKIGNQFWMAENLKYLPSVAGPATGSQTTPYYYVYGYDGTDISAAKATVNYNTYGVLYNWPAAMAGSESSSDNPSGVQGVCPVGWHLPSNAEWTQLTDYLGGANVAGGKLKETGTTHWVSPNTGATDEGGFKALPGGCRTLNDTFNYFGNNGFWCSATGEDIYMNWRWVVYYNNSNISSTTVFSQLGYSVRCLRD